MGFFSRSGFRPDHFALESIKVAFSAPPDNRQTDRIAEGALNTALGKAFPQTFPPALATALGKMLAKAPAMVAP
jgi:hypothetical protein